MEGNAAPKPEMFERRRHGRLTELFDVDAVLLSGPKAGDQLAGKVINISKGGAAIIFKQAVPERLQLSLTIFSDEDQSVCSGVVVWTKEIKGRMVHGVQIADWSYMDALIERELPHP